MKLTIDTSVPPSPTDRQILSVYLSHDVAETLTEPAENNNVPEEPVTEAEQQTATLDDAIDLATELVSNGETDLVRKVLDSIGVGRVSELSGGQIANFIARVKP